MFGLTTQRYEDYRVVAYRDVILNWYKELNYAIQSQKSGTYWYGNLTLVHQAIDNSDQKFWYKMEQRGKQSCIKTWNSRPNVCAYGALNNFMQLGKLTIFLMKLI